MSADTNSRNRTSRWQAEATRASARAHFTRSILNAFFHQGTKVHSEATRGKRSHLKLSLSLSVIL
jgi:hypothetical protein